MQDAGLARPAELQRAFATALERTSRTVRLAYALQANLRRAANRAEREDADAQARRDREEVRFKKQRLRTGVEALIWRDTDAMDQETPAPPGRQKACFRRPIGRPAPMAHMTGI